MRSSFLAASLLILTTLAVPASSQPYVVTIDEAGLYEQGAGNARVLTTLPPNAVAELLGCRVSWCEVRFDGVRGFLRQRTVARTDRAPQRRIEPVAEAQPPARPIPVGREGPDPDPAPQPPQDWQEAAATTESGASIVRQPSLPPEGGAVAPDRGATEQAMPPDPAPAPPPTPSLVREAASAPGPPRATPPPEGPANVPFKNPATGRLASVLLPGGGHLYAGEPGVGAVLLVLSVAAPAAGYFASDRTGDPDCASPGPEAGWVCTDTANYGPLLVGAAVAATAWVAGFLDAGAAVRRSNERVATERIATERVAERVSLHPVAGARYSGLALRVSF